MASSSNPDLSSVLRTLSAFANPASTPPQHRHQHHQHERPPHTPPTHHPSPPNPPSTPNLKKKPQTNAANITTYPPALKHIMHLTTQNADFSPRIQHLIKSQREHERTWWKAREALIEKQAARKEKRRRIKEVLKSVGASNATAAASATEDTTEKISQENATELRAYDSKVYQASVDMARVMETELRRLGVPFFCIDRTLVSSTEEEDEKGGGETSGAAEDGGKKATKISKEELDVLKRKVLDLLVDLCS